MESPQSKRRSKSLSFTFKKKYLAMLLLLVFAMTRHIALNPRNLTTTEYIETHEQFVVKKKTLSQQSHSTPISNTTCDCYGDAMIMK